MNKGKKVKLQVEPVAAEIKICEQELEVTKEQKKGSQERS